MAIIPFTCMLGIILVAMLMLPLIAYASHYNKTFHVTWGHDRAKILNIGKLLTLSLDKYSGSGFESKGRYLFGKFDMKIKLVRGNSAGTVTTFFLSSNGPDHDEIDFEFLGNVSGQPYTIHTNVYSKGLGDREQQFHLWFDPTSDFHTYSVTWNPYHIVFSVDGKPIREVMNMEKIGVPYPMKNHMKIYASLWEADDWATMGGRIKTDWAKALFIASYGDFGIRACKWISKKGSSCPTNYLSSGKSLDKKYEWMSKELDYMSKKRLKMVQNKYMIYNYCTDKNRFPQGYPPECKKSSI